jgi:hypothetical protein
MRDHLASAFREIATREHLTRRHAAIRRIISKHPDAAKAMLD